MTIKKQRGRKRKGYIYTGDNPIFEKQVEKVIALRSQKEDLLNSFKFIIGRHLHRARNGVGITLEELGLKIGVTTSQLHKYEAAETIISTSRFFLAILYLFNNKSNKFLQEFFNSLINDIQKSFNENNVSLNKEITYKIQDDKTNKMKINIQEQILKMDRNELQNILNILKLINKNKESILNNLSIEQI